MAQTPRKLTPGVSPLHYFGARLRQHRSEQGLSQDQLGQRVHVSGHLIGKIEIAARRPSEDLARRLDGVLGTGGELTDLWPLIDKNRDYRAKSASIPAHEGHPSDEADADEETGGDVQRRDLFGASGAILTAAALAHVAQLADHLTSYVATSTSGPGVPEAPPWSLSRASVVVARVKRDYQACRYTAVLDELPGLLVGVRLLQDTLTGDDLSAVHALAAAAYHVASSVLLKHDDVQLATLAADRSILAAQYSGDPIALASSARIVTHVLMSGSHPARAHRFAVDSAHQLRSSHRRPTREASAVMGALLLRGAIAAARADDRTATQILLDEAAATARGMPENGNDRWTGFNPTNVLLHRVNSALVIGDAGTAIALAKQVDLTKVVLVERKASLYLDVAQAYTQWGKWEQALAALNHAAATAPQEVSSRPAAKRLFLDLAGRSPRSVRVATLKLASAIGVHL
jgi:transcriptional regulator with XRE-family HTH domain